MCSQVLPSKIKLLSEVLKTYWNWMWIWICFILRKGGNTHIDTSIIKKNKRRIYYNFLKGSTFRITIGVCEEWPSYFFFSYQDMIDIKHQSFRYMEWHNSDEASWLGYWSCFCSFDSGDDVTFTVTSLAIWPISIRLPDKETFPEIMAFAYGWV